MIQQRIYKNVISLGYKCIEEANGDFRIAIQKAFEACKFAEDQIYADPETKRLFRRLVCLAVMIAKRERSARERRN